MHLLRCMPQHMSTWMAVVHSLPVKYVHSDNVSTVYCIWVYHFSSRAKQNFSFGQNVCLVSSPLHLVGFSFACIILYVCIHAILSNLQLHSTTMYLFNRNEITFLDSLTIVHSFSQLVITWVKPGRGTCEK